MPFSISEIKAMYQAACEDELPAFIQKFEQDERAGVQKILEGAMKKLDAYHAEKERIWKLQEYERIYKVFTWLLTLRDRPINAIMPNN